MTEDPKKMAEDALIDQYNKTGRREFFSELFRRYMYPVYGLCLKYLKDREKAKDMVMQIFEKLIIVLPEQKINNFSAWLYVFSKNLCLMHLRSEKASLARNRKWMEEQEKIMESDFSLHPIDNMGSVIEKRLEECIEKLKDEQKLCVRMFYFEDLCYREISEKNNWDEKKVKSLLQNGKRNLKICMENQHV